MTETINPQFAGNPHTPGNPQIAGLLQAAGIDFPELLVNPSVLLQEAERWQRFSQKLAEAQAPLSGAVQRVAAENHGPAVVAMSGSWQGQSERLQGVSDGARFLAAALVMVTILVAAMITAVAAIAIAMFAFRGARFLHRNGIQGMRSHFSDLFARDIRPWLRSAEDAFGKLRTGGYRAVPAGGPGTVPVRATGRQFGPLQMNSKKKGDDGPEEEDQGGLNSAQDAIDRRETLPGDPDDR